MKSRVSYSAVAIVIAGVVSTWQMYGASAAADPAANTAVSSMVAVGADHVRYVGTNKCKLCHIKEYKSWKKTKHAQAMETLKPGNASEVKQKFGLDPAKDYSSDKTCLACHTVGFGKPGGYAVPDPANKKSVRHAKHTANVGCEMCHGAGGAFVDTHTEIMKSKRKYTDDEMYAAGMTKIEKSTCTGCHNGKSPTIDAATYKFDYQQRLKDGVHEHFPLKQRKE